jgi:hypothetical protein
LFSNFLNSSGVLGISGGGTNLSSYTTGDTLYASASNTLSNRAIGSTNQVLSISGGVPVWGALPSNATLTAYTSGSGNWNPASYTGTFVLVRMWAGGGSGGKASAAQTPGGGGGGAYMERFYLLSGFSTTLQPYSVGAGGAAVSGASGITGNPGNNSTFGTGSNAFTVYGGGAGSTGGGSGGQAGQLFAVGAAAFTQTGIDATQYWLGGSGGGNARAGGNGWMGGGGGGGASAGASPLAGGTSVGGGAGGAAAANANATDGSVPGGGGGGCTSSTSGHTSGKGGDGRIEVWVW